MKERRTHRTKIEHIFMMSAKTAVSQDVVQVYCVDQWVRIPTKVSLDDNLLIQAL